MLDNQPGEAPPVTDPGPLHLLYPVLGKLEAFSLGVYGKVERLAVIHVEKANPEIRGLYPFICQQFLLHEFLDALLVNREDDIGLEGIRKSKLSYNPIYREEKYEIRQK